MPNPLLRELKLLWDGDESDEVLDVYLEIAGRAIINRAYPYDETRDTVPPRYQHLQVEIAIFLLSKQGAEGQTTHTENGVSRGWGSGTNYIPSSYLDQIVPMVGVI